MKMLLFAAFFAWAGAASAAKKAQPHAGRAAPASPAVEASTGAARAPTVGDLYAGAKYRDPFAALAGAGGLAEQPQAAEDGAEAAEYQFSIHSLSLRGIMKDRRGASAVLVDAKTGQGFILRSGLLFDYKNHRIPGVRGAIHTKQKSVTLTTPEKDSQTLRLGEDEGGDAGKESP